MPNLVRHRTSRSAVRCGAPTDGERVHFALDIDPSSIRPDGQTIRTTLCGRRLLRLPVGDLSRPNGAPRNIRFMKQLK